MHDAEIIHAIDHDIGDLNRIAAGGGAIDTAVGQDPADAVRQPFQDIAIQGIGTAEAMDNLGFRALLVLVPDVLGKRVLLDRRPVSILPFGVSKIHT
jgi:hypothetical protein